MRNLIYGIGLIMLIILISCKSVDQNEKTSSETRILDTVTPRIDSNLKDTLGKIQGIYVGALRVGGWEDTLNFYGDSVKVQKSLEDFYGVPHTYVYAIKYLEEDTILFEQTRHWIYENEEPNGAWIGELDGHKMIFVAINENRFKLEFVYESAQREIVLTRKTN